MSSDHIILLLSTHGNIKFVILLSAKRFTGCTLFRSCQVYFHSSMKAYQSLTRVFWGFQGSSRSSVDGACRSWSIGRGFESHQGHWWCQEGLPATLLLCSKDISVPRPAQKKAHFRVSHMLGYGDFIRT